ncbi:MAG: M6 family metalloprotease domain-containing protein, partial [bacterium]
MTAKKNFSLILIILFSLLLSASVWSVAPTKEAIEKWKADGVLEEKINNWKNFKALGGCSPVEHSVFDKKKAAENLALGVQAIDTVKVIVILVEFSDWLHGGQAVSGEPYMFDSVLFTDRTPFVESGIDSGYFNPTGSMTDFYMENSYGKFYIQGDIFGWLMMPQTYAWYENGDDGLTRGSILATDAVIAADAAGANFVNYDHDLDNNCDGVIIVHPGRGAEEGVYGIWSHKSTLSATQHPDQITVSNYTMNPEEATTGTGIELSPIGVFCHEYGHFLSLPDLYDIDYALPGHEGSAGLGDWSLMAQGNYLGGSKSPAHMDPWCKAQIGFLNFTEVTSNIFNAEIPCIEFNPFVYQLKYDNSEYWIIENRQKSGFDKYLPGSGLCIYHVDLDAPQQNTAPSRYYVGLEEADGDSGLAYIVNNTGDMGDPFPGASVNRNFNEQSIPNSLTNFDLSTQIGVWNISNSDSLMYADLDVRYSRPWIDSSGSDWYVFDDSQDGDGDGIFEAGETVQFFCTVVNKMRNSYNVHATLTTSNPDVIFTTPTVSFNEDLFIDPKSNLIPIEFVLADSVIPRIDSFFVTITTDSLPGNSGSGEFQKTFGFEVEVGAPQILLVDDDRGAAYESYFQEAFYSMRVPLKTWTKAIKGSPDSTDLSQFSMVFWYTGDSAISVLSIDDINAMKGFLNNGGGLFLSTMSGIGDLNTLDNTFLTEKLHASIAGTDAFWVLFDGVPGTAMGDNVQYRYR